MQLGYAGACLPRRRQAAFRGLELLRPLRHTAPAGCTRKSGRRKLPISSWVALENSPEVRILGTRCKKMEAWYVDDGDIMCHPIPVPSHLHDFDVANAKVGAERSPQRTEVICNLDDLGAAPLKRRIMT